MTIESKEVFITKGKQFDTQEKAEQYRADLIGEYLDKAPVLLGPGDRIKINEFIVRHRVELRKLLDF